MSLLKIYLFFVIMTLSFSNLKLFAEVEKITIRWTAMECDNICMPHLDQQFKKIPGVSEITMNPGQAEIKWKANAPFYLPSIKIAMQMIGLYMTDLRVKVRGIIKHSPTDVYLISSGDNTEFNLLNPVIPDPQRQAPQYNRAARALTPELRQKLLEAEARQQIAIIEGPIFMPERSPPDPLALVVDQIKFVELKDQNDKKTINKK